MIRIGLIGGHNQVISHSDVYLKMQDVEIAGYFNPSDEPTEGRSEKIKRIRRFEDLLSASDALDFVAEEKRCVKLALQGLKASKHVLIKPAAIENKSQTNQLTKLANEAHVVLMTVSPVKFHAALNAALPQMKNLRLIEIENRIAIKNKHTWENIQSSMLQDLDIIHTVLKSNIKNIKTTGVKMINGNPDIVNVRLEYDNGCVVNLNSSWIVSEEKHVGMFMQQDRITKINFLNDELLIYKPETMPEIKGQYVLKPVIREIVRNNPGEKELQNFIHSVRNSSRLISNPEEGFKSLFIAEKILDNLNKSLAI